MLDTSTVILLPRSDDASTLPVEPLIAATAMANGLPVYTCNATDFAGIAGLTVVDDDVPGMAQSPT